MMQAAAPMPRARSGGGASLQKWLMAGLGLVTVALFVAWSRALRDPLGSSESTQVLEKLRQELAQQRRRAETEAAERAADRAAREKLSAELSKRDEELSTLRQRAAAAERRGQGKQPLQEAAADRHSLGSVDTVDGQPLPTRFEMGKLQGTAAAFGPDAWLAVVAPDRDMAQPDGVAQLEEFERTLWPRLLPKHSTSPVTGDIGTPEQRLDRLQRWALGGGVTFPKVRLRALSKSNAELRGVTAIEDIRAGEGVITVPLRMLIHDGMALETPVGAKCHQVAGAPQELLVIFLLTDARKEQSSHRAYYQALPQTYDDYAIFWDSQKMRAMRGSDFITRRNTLLWSWVEAYERVTRCAGDLAAGWTLQEWLWARLVVMTRNFRITLADGPHKALAPIADMLNHRLQPRMVRWQWSADAETLQISAQRGINGSAEIRMSYGDKESKRYLLWYNFVDERAGERECQGDHAEVRWLEQDQPDGEAQVFRLTYSNVVDWIYRLATDIRRRVSGVDWVGNEWLLWASALMRASRIAQAKLQTFATELAADVERVQGSDAQAAPRVLAARALVTEKQILSHVLRLSEVAVPQLAKWRQPGWRLVDPDLLETTVVPPHLMPKCARDRLQADIKTIMLRGRGTVVKGATQQRLRGSAGGSERRHL